MREAIQTTRDIFKRKKLARFMYRFKFLGRFRDWCKFNFINGSIRISDIKSLVSKGEVVYGQVVLASSILFSEQESESSPAVVLFSTDKHYDGNLYELEELSDYLYDLTQCSEVPLNLKEITDMLIDVNVYFLNKKIPVEYTGGREVFITSIPVDISHIPYGYLRGSVLPIIINPKRTKATMILPKEYWSNEMLFQWYQQK